MSAKCNYCYINIYDEDGQCYGDEYPNGEIVCHNCLVSIAGLHKVLWYKMVSLGIGFRPEDIVILATEVHKYILEGNHVSKTL